MYVCNLVHNNYFCYSHTKSGDIITKSYNRIQVDTARITGYFSKCTHFLFNCLLEASATEIYDQHYDCT